MFIPPQAIAVAHTLSTFTFSSAASAKTSLRLGSHAGTLAASASERTPMNDAPFFMPGSSGSMQSSRLLRNSSRGTGRKSLDANSVFGSLQVSIVLGSTLAMVLPRVGQRRSSRISSRTGYEMAPQSLSGWSAMMSRNFGMSTLRISAPSSTCLRFSDPSRVAHPCMSWFLTT